MSWITIIWSAAGGGCLILAAVHFLVWLNSRASWANLAFSVAALMAATTILIQLKMMLLQTSESNGYWLWMMQVPMAIMLIALGFFIRFQMKSRRSWLLWLLIVSQVALFTVPYMQGLLILIVLVGMAYELSLDMIHGNNLARELKQSQERMRLIAASAKLGLLEWNIPDNKVWLNEVGKELLGVSEDSRAGIDRIFQRVHPIDVDKLRTALFEAVECKPEIDLEFRLAGPDPPRWMALRGRVERDAKDNPLLFRCVSIDITEQKRIQAQLREERIELAHMQRVSAMGQLSSALAHEINQPLGAILRNSEAAELFLQRDPPDLEELAEIIRDIKKDEQRASSVIERMRSMLKRRDLNFEPIKIDELVGQVITLLNTEFQLRNVHYALDIPPDLPAVTGDRIQLQQVLLNLLSNSFDSIALLPDEVSKDRAQIIINAFRSGDDSVELAIADYGVGIEPNLFPRLFTPFVTSKAQGIGLGLSLSQMILATHGGKISAENMPQGGARFCFTLKIA